MMTRLLLCFALLLSACASGTTIFGIDIDNVDRTRFEGGLSAPGGDTLNPAIWRSDTIVWGVSRAPGSPRNPFPHPEGWSVPIPQRPGQVGYVTYNPGPIVGSGIRLRARLEGDADARVYAVDEGQPDHYPLLLTFFLQRRGDDWTGNGRLDTYRWWAAGSPHRLVIGEEFELVVRFDSLWTAVNTATSINDPAAFAAARADAQALGFVFGGNSNSYGHGGYAVGNVRLVVLAFEVLP